MLNVAIANAMLRSSNSDPAGTLRNLLTGYQSPPTGVSPTPSQKEADEFLLYFRAAVAREPKDPDLRGKRMEALVLVRQFNKGPDFCSAFTKVNRRQFAVELALRIRAPRLVAQNQSDLSGGLNLCGPNSLILDYAKRQPLEFATFAISLAENGGGSFHRWQVTPDSALLNMAPPAKLSPIDFVLLGSLRHGDSWYFEVLDSIQSLTKPAMLCAWLEKAGFKNVRDCTFIDDQMSLAASLLNKVTSFDIHTPGRQEPSKGKTSLRNMEYALQQGRLVAMLGSVALAGALVKGANLPERPSGMIPDLHWMLVRKLRIANDELDIKLYTYGRSVEKHLPLADLAKYYNGFVEASYGE